MNAQLSLFSAPAGGRLRVSAERGAWWFAKIRAGITRGFNLPPGCSPNDIDPVDDDERERRREEAEEDKADIRNDR